jgi:hypothetical protein
MVAMSAMWHFFVNGVTLVDDTIYSKKISMNKILDYVTKVCSRGVT